MLADRVEREGHQMDDVNDVGTRQTLTVAEAAKVLGVSRGTAYEAARRGELPVIRIGGRLLVSRHALAQLLGSGN